MLCSANSKPGLSRLLGFRHPTLRKRGPETTSQRNQERNQEALRSESFVAFVGCKLQQPWLDASENLHSSKEKYFKASLVGGNIFFLTCPLVWPPPSYFEPLKGHFPQALGPISKCLARDTARPAHGAVASSMGESTPEVEGRSWASLAVCIRGLSCKRIHISDTPTSKKTPPGFGAPAQVPFCSEPQRPLR
jgi:hypothetical protein